MLAVWQQQRSGEATGARLTAYTRMIRSRKVQNMTDDDPLAQWVTGSREYSTEAAIGHWCEGWATTGVVQSCGSCLRKVYVQQTYTQRLPVGASHALVFAMQARLSGRLHPRAWRAAQQSRCLPHHTTTWAVRTRRGGRGSCSGCEPPMTRWQ